MASGQPETQQGTAILVFGPPDAASTSTLGALTFAGFIVSSFSFTPSADEVRTPDETGKTVNITTYNFAWEAQLTVKPRATTKALAEAAANQMPTIGARCIITNTTSARTWSLAAFSNTSTGNYEYRVKAVSLNGEPGQPVPITITIERVEGITNYTPA